MQLLRLFSKTSVITLLLGLIGTIVVFIAIDNLEYRAAHFEFERRAANRIAGVEAGLRDASGDVSLVNRLFITMGIPSAQQFEYFVSPLLQNNIYIQNFSFQRLISSAERAAFEERMRATSPDFSIREVTDGKLEPAREKKSYRVIEYVVPMQKNKAVFGLDTSSRPHQDAAVLRACRTGLPSATKPYTLVHNNMTMRGFVMLAPLYRAGTDLNDVERRCDNVIGYTVAAFDAKKLVEWNLDRRKLQNDKGYALAVYVREHGSTNDLVFQSSYAKTFPAGESSVFDKWLGRKPFNTSSDFDVAGLTWRVEVAVLPLQFFDRHLISIFTLFSGLFLSLLAMVYVQSQILRTRRAKQLSDEREEKLRQEKRMRDRNRQLEEEREHLRTLFDRAPSFVAILSGPQHIFEIANLAYYDLVGHRNILGKPVRDALPELEGQGFFELLDQVYETGQPYEGKSRPIVTEACENSGETRYVDFVYQPMRDAHDKVTGIFVQGTDISVQTNAQRQLEKLTGHDPLTGLPNANLISTLLSQKIQTRNSGEKIFVLVVDIDGFESAIKSFGLSVANGVLRLIGERLQSVCSDGGLVGGLGGDKFLCVFQEACDEDPYCVAVRRVREAIGNRIEIDNHELYLACSIGIATYPLDADNADSLIRYADIAMYSAKMLGSNNFQFYKPEQDAQVRERLKLETNMRGALDRDEFVLHYQPQLDLVTGRVVAVETLIRWNHPELGLLGPNRFISVAESTGLIFRIGEWALRTACLQMKAWHTSGLDNLRVAVNLSARQFAHDDLVELIDKILQETELPAEFLDLELTESLVMSDVDQAISILNRLSKLGVQLSVDDFGTGYSSLSYLKRFPINVIKIDRSFIHEIPHNANDAAIADAIISMAHSLGMRVIAEGVETEAQCEFLSRNLCDEIQGFLFSQALPSEEVAKLLKESHVLPDHLLRLHKPVRKLLLVDDEPSILSSLRRLLRNDGYEIMTASDGQAGLDLLASHTIDVIVSDQRMPGMTGVEFLRKVKTIYPETVRIVLSGFTELKSVTDAVNEGAIYKFLTKPWEDAQLREHIAEAFRHKEMADENRRLSIQVRVSNQELASTNRKLEDALRYKQQQVQRREISLDIVREALQYIPLPVIGLDEDDIIVFANNAAGELFDGRGLILGSQLAQLVPELTQAIPDDEMEQQHDVVVNGASFHLEARRMGHGTQSRGSLIFFSGRE